MEPILEISYWELLQAMVEAIAAGPVNQEEPVTEPPKPEAREEPRTNPGPDPQNSCRGTSSLTQPEKLAEDGPTPRPTSVHIPSSPPKTVSSQPSKPKVPQNWEPYRKKAPTPKPDVPLYLPVEIYELCWRCGYPGHSRRECTTTPRLFCSKCGLYGTMTRDCRCHTRHRSRRSRGPSVLPIPQCGGTITCVNAVPRTSQYRCYFFYMIR